MATKTVVTKTPVTPVKTVVTKPVVNPPKPPSVGSVQSVINRGSAAGYDGGISKGMYRVEVGGKVIDTGNSTTLANLLKQGGKITMSPGQQPQQPAFDEAKFREEMLNQQKGMIDNLFNQQKASQLAQMQASRDKAVGQLSQQRQTIAPEFANKRNQSDVVNAQNVQRLREMMAANGLSASGENVSANVAMNNERANSINSLNLQEQQTYQDIDRRVADLYNPADENAMVAALEAERSRAMMDAYNRATDQGYQRSRDAVGDQRYNQEWNYQQGRDQIADKRYDTEWNYGVGRDKIEDNRYTKEQELEEYWRQKQWNEMPPAEKAAILFRESLQNNGRSSGGSKKSSGGSSSKSKSKTSSSKTTPTSSLVQQFKAEKAAASKTPLDQYYESQVLRSPKNYLQDIFQPVAPRDNKNLSPWELMKMMGG